MLSINKKMLFYISILTTFTVMFAVNTLTPYIADDYTYATSNSLYDVFNNEYWQYMNWGGRSIAHINARIFLMMPKIVFNVINSFIYVLLTVLVYFFAKLKVKEDFSVVTYIFVSACLWLYLPDFGQTVLWLTGSCNYLWGTVFVLLFLCPYRLYFSGETVFKGKWIPLIIMFFIGVFAGWSNENTSGGCILLILLLSGYEIYNKMKIKSWMVSGFLGALIGFSFMVLAPGNALRSQELLKSKSRFAVMSSNISKSVYFIENSLMILM